MYDNISLWDLLPEDDEERIKYQPIKSTDWKWSMENDYPKEKNGLKVFSCFACGGGSTMGYKLAGCDVIGCCEIDPKMNNVYIANHHPKHNFLMDIRKFNEIPNEELPSELFNLDILDGSPPCFEKGTLIKTVNGYKPIEEICVGDYVLTHKGNYKEVYDTMNKVSNDYYELKIQGCIPIKVTKNHPFYVRTMSRIGHKCTRTLGEPKWVNCEDLHIKKNSSNSIIEQDYIGFPIIKTLEIPNWSGVEYEHNIYGKKVIRKIKNKLDLNDCRFWHFVGRYIGDGWLRESRKEVIVCCGKDELKELASICDKAKFTYNVSEQASTYRFTISNEKHLTSDIFNLPIKQLKAFIDGYMSADGYIDKHNVYKISTVSKDLAFGIQQCVAKVYHSPTTITMRKPKCEIQGREVNTSICYTVSFRKEHYKQQHYFYENGYIWLPFRYKKYINDPLNVYNFSVKDDESYTVYNLAVHNCTTFSMAGEREDSWGKKKKFREGQSEQTLDDLSFVFIDTVAKLRAKVVVMENVEGLLLGNAFEYVRKIHKQFKDIGYKAMHKLLKGEEMGVPQSRHRVFFIATRLDFDFENLDLTFNYEPITYGEIKEGELKPLGKQSKFYQIAAKATDYDKSIADTRIRLGEKGSAFQTIYIRDDQVVPTQRTRPDLIDIKNIAYISKETIRNAQTFPQDYKFLPDNYANIGYICGMSVPPIMIKRIVTRLIESGIFEI